MKLNLLLIIIWAVVGMGIITLATGQIKWGSLIALIIAVGGAKWLRIKKQEENEEIQFDERVNHNIKAFSMQTFSIANLLLFIYLFVSSQFSHKQTIDIHFLMIYLAATFMVAFYIVPFIARKR